MIRVYFVFQDPLDEDEVNLSFVDVPTQEPGDAFGCVERAAASGDLWRSMYPDEQEHAYKLLNSKMLYLDISGWPHVASADTILMKPAV